MGKRYIALRRLTLGSGRVVEIGGEVPEAVNWPNLRHYIGARHIRVDDDAMVPPPHAPPMPPVMALPGLASAPPVRPQAAPAEAPPIHAAAGSGRGGRRPARR